MHCLNLKITYQCTNHCSFCFSSYLANEQISVNGLVKAIVDGRSRGCKELVISGGEPTLLPDVIPSDAGWILISLHRTVTHLVEVFKHLRVGRRCVVAHGSLTVNEVYVSQTQQVCVVAVIHIAWVHAKTFFLVVGIASHQMLGTIAATCGIP